VQDRRGLKALDASQPLARTATATGTGAALHAVQPDPLLPQISPAARCCHDRLQFCRAEISLDNHATKNSEILPPVGVIKRVNYVQRLYNNLFCRVRIHTKTCKVYSVFPRCTNLRFISKTTQKLLGACHAGKGMGPAYHTFSRKPLHLFRCPQKPLQEVPKLYLSRPKSVSR
jgi:hypothetical protein